ncbi:MAG: hypothetical protein C3F13_19060 [Anaerolineales bacterium]|nr:hypothetical protein [Anaerolineae bacterium]PWB49500.1 MAG: hypothetical protein C3F13_19060 [Anaerolineales bacterium]
MKKKIIFTCALLAILAVAVTACKLPASGNPPPVATQQPIIPTTTTGIQAEPTNTSLPPTQVLVPATPIPTSTVPATEVSPPPTAVPVATLPSASRIQFAAGGTGATVEGIVDTSQTLYYVLKANASQTMSVKLASPNGDVYLGVFGADGQVLLNSSAQQTTWSGTLPATQDYYLSMTAGNGKSSYTLTVDIPPGQAAPTANVTPITGSFNPVAVYGPATFEDPMTGGNINDWTNPTTGLLPNTSYIKISEIDAKFYVTGKMPGFSTWYFQWRELSDFYLQSTFDSGSCAGKDAYGLIVRGPEHQAGVSYGYVVSFTCDGSLWVFRLDGANPYTTKELVSYTPSSYIIAGTNKQNVMGIKFIGNTITVYANGNQIAEIFDNKFTSGRYGVFVSPENTTNYTYRVVEMSYWDLAKK